MAISIDQSTSPLTIFIPKADTTLVQAASGSFPEIRSLNMQDFHNELRTLQTQTPETVLPTTHNHTKEGTLGAVTYPRRIQITNAYQVEFEDGQYRVRLVGGDNNLEDRQVANQVSVSTFNSAGNSVVETGVSGLTNDESTKLTNIDTRTVTLDTRMREVWALMGLEVGNKVVITPTGITTEDGSITVDFAGDGEATTEMTRQTPP